MDPPIWPNTIRAAWKAKCKIALSWRHLEVRCSQWNPRGPPLAGGDCFLLAPGSSYTLFKQFADAYLTLL
jgi:hypothetical protein